MEDRETARMRKYGESKTTRIMMATVPHVISGLGLKISGRWIFVDTSVQGLGFRWQQCDVLVALNNAECRSWQREETL